MRNVNQSMYDFMKEGVQNDSQTALCFLLRRISYRELFRETDAIASALMQRGFKRGDCVTIALPNIPTAVSAFYACNKLGITVNLVHPLTPAAQLIEYMNACNSSVLFGFDKILNGEIGELTEAGITVIACQTQYYLNAGERTVYEAFTRKDRNRLKGKVLWFRQLLRVPVLATQSQEPAETAVIMHSGGTTEKPKSICLSDRAFNEVAIGTQPLLKVAPKECMLDVLPMFHAFGLGVCVHSVLSYGGSVALIPKYSPKKMATVMRRHRVTLLVGVPTMFAGMLVQKNFRGRILRRVRAAYCGGDKLPQKLKREFDERVKAARGTCVLDEGYGMTECAGVFCANYEGHRRPGSIGKPIGSNRAAVFDESFREVLPPNTAGQLCLCGTTLMNGYLSDRTATEDALFFYQNETWLKTGDFGKVDEDGYLYFTQRLKRIVKVSGVPVFPAVVEEVVGSVEGVLACCAFAIPHERKGSVLKVCIVADPSVPNVTERVDRVCRSRLNKWEYPREIEQVEALPLTPLGKPDYRALEKRYASERQP